MLKCSLCFPVIIILRYSGDNSERLTLYKRIPPSAFIGHITMLLTLSDEVNKNSMRLSSAGATNHHTIFSLIPGGHNETRDFNFCVPHCHFTRIDTHKEVDFI